MAALIQRRKDILNLIREDGHAKVQKLAKIFNVSEVTIRQDLEILEQMGYVQREHGGAFLKDVGDFAKTGKLFNQTHMEEKQEIERGHFREDLYFRLSVFQIHLLPLRERKQDIESLAQTFLERFSAKLKKPIDGITPEALAALTAAEWKGNVRELRNVMERSAIICEGRITLEDLPLELQRTETVPSDAGDDFELASIERKHILKVLQYTHGYKTETARLLKIGLATLYRKIETYGIAEGKA